MDFLFQKTENLSRRPRRIWGFEVSHLLPFPLAPRVGSYQAAPLQSLSEEPVCGWWVGEALDMLP